MSESKQRQVPHGVLAVLIIMGLAFLYSLPDDSVKIHPVAVQAPGGTPVLQGQYRSWKWGSPRNFELTISHGGGWVFRWDDNKLSGWSSHLPAFLDNQNEGEDNRPRHDSGW